MGIVALLYAVMAALWPVQPAPAVQRPVLSVTAYCATGHLNAAGGVPQVGQAASNRWPFGTKIAVPGYGLVTVEDRIGSGSDLDLFFGSDASCTRRADQWGRQQLTVTVYRRPIREIKPAIANARTTKSTTDMPLFYPIWMEHT